APASSKSQVRMLTQENSPRAAESAPRRWREQNGQAAQMAGAAFGNLRTDRPCPRVGSAVQPDALPGPAAAGWHSPLPRSRHLRSAAPDRSWDVVAEGAEPRPLGRGAESPGHDVPAAPERQSEHARLLDPPRTIVAERGARLSVLGSARR